MLVVTILLSKFTNNFFDNRTGKNIVYLEKKYAKININSINSLLTTTLLKIQASLNEQILFYQKLANKTNEITDYTINQFLKCVLDLDDNFLSENQNDLKYMGYWFISNDIREDNLTNNSPEKLQLIVYSNVIQNIYSTLEATKSSVPNYYLVFEKTNLFINFPVEYDYKEDNLKIFSNYTKNPIWCTDKNGEVYKTYKFKCRDYYNNCQKAKKGIFDINYLDQSYRTIYITNSNKHLGIQGNSNVFTMCIEFYDSISKGNGYACTDIYQDDLKFSFDNFNSKLVGYYLITSVGFNNMFYYPQSNNTIKTPAESIFRWDRNFYLGEKINFINNVQKLITSNYIKYITESGSSSFEEIKINGVNTSEQYFSLNGEKYYFSLYPVILENINGAKEHVLSIVYFYNNQIYYNSFKYYLSNNNIKIFLEILLFTIFGACVLYLVVLSFNTLAKYIVVPIKNVNYMLKGIHIGGENRLEYLDFLKKRQNENLEKLEKIYSGEKKFKKEKLDESDNHILNNKNKEEENNLENKNNKNNLNNNYTKEEKYLNKTEDDEENKNFNNLEYNGEIINPKIDYNKKYDLESNYIEKEFSFYDFDEELLQYRPLEIDRLVKVLLDLKGALLLTSNEHPVQQIINYSYSEEIFHNFKNKEGAKICQSNIGNLQSQLLKYDKAIYHLALSLQEEKLKKFLSRTLSDELDESDSLFNKIFLSYNKDKDKEKNNILVEKQQNNSRDNFSQKLIGILINSRYCKLIHVYFKFFSIVQKSDIDKLSGQFMNTSFHKINYYHKILIQYIYLSYIKNDLVKIGESILDYIEFLIKFKFKISHDNKFVFNIHNKDRPEFRDKQKYKKKIFDKILNWLNLFDSYVSHVRDNSSLGDDKSIVEDYSQTLDSSNNDLNSGSQSAFLFRVNMQRGDFLKGKFSLACKSYHDAIYYFIRAAKKKSIVLDGLLQKRALKHIYKITMKLNKQLQSFGIINQILNEKLLEYKKIKQHITSKNLKLFYNDKNKLNNEEGKNFEEKNENTFKDEMEIIKKEITNEINECNAKQSKDIIILIDFNSYENELNNIGTVDSYIDQTKTILNNYLSNNDRLGVFIFTKQYQIVCPLMCKIQIDKNNFANDLNYYKKKRFIEIEKTEEYLLNENELPNEKIEFQSNNVDNFSEERSDEDSFVEDDNSIKNIKTISGLLKSIYYIKNYLRKKEAIKNEKYIILFTDLFNYFSLSDEEIGKKFENLNGDKEIHFLLVGKKGENLKKEKEIISDEKEDKILKEYIREKFGDKSELIEFENMKKIKTILSNNNVIKDEIIYPNEIYK